MNPMITDQYLQQYLESIGIPANWKENIGSEDYYLGQIIISLVAANNYKMGRMSNLQLASKWIAQLINKFYVDENAIKENLVNHPKHYNTGKIEVIAFLSYLELCDDFCLGNAIKYLSRYRHKGNQVEDLKKAEWYINYLIK